jgi:hypothetical protein
MGGVSKKYMHKLGCENFLQGRVLSTYGDALRSRLRPGVENWPNTGYEAVVDALQLSYQGPVLSTSYFHLALHCELSM